jgi:putative glutamine amidotransferase
MSTADRPRILVTAGAAYDLTAYLHSLEASGAEPVVARPGPRLPVEAWDAVVLAGGVDVSPARFGAQVPADVAPRVQVDLDRDALEWEVLDEVERRGLPLLAICRGLQVLNVYRGGTLRLDLATEGFTAIRHRQRDRIREPVHEVVVAEGRLRSILGGERAAVNSSHHQAVRRAAPDLRVVAHAPDGVIEGLESADGRLIAVQWHPERLFDTQEAARRLFSDLVARAAAGVPATAIVA